MSRWISALGALVVALAGCGEAAPDPECTGEGPGYVPRCPDGWVSWCGYSGAVCDVGRFAWEPGACGEALAPECRDGSAPECVPLEWAGSVACDSPIPGCDEETREPSCPEGHMPACIEGDGMARVTPFTCGEEVREVACGLTGVGCESGSFLAVPSCVPCSP